MTAIGMGGYFFRAQDPAALKAWYKEHLGVGGGCGTGPDGKANEWVWFTQGGPMVFEPFAADRDYFARDKPVMINLRVTDLEALVARLEAAGIEVQRKDEWNATEIGTFSRIHDPEGNPIELWEPKG